MDRRWELDAPGLASDPPAQGYDPSAQKEAKLIDQIHSSQNHRSMIHDIGMFDPKRDAVFPDSKPRLNDDILLPNSELRLDYMPDDISVLTSDTCFTNSSAMSESNSQLCLPDEVLDYDEDLTFRTPASDLILNYSKSISVSSLAATENAFGNYGEDNPTSFGVLAQQSHSPQETLRLLSGFEAVLSEVRSAAQRRHLERIARSSWYSGPGEASKICPGFEAVLSDVRSGTPHRRLRRQGTLSAISETAPDVQDDSSAPSSKADSTGERGDRSKSGQEQSPLPRLPPPVLPPRQLAESISEKQPSRPTTPIISTAVTPEEETMYTTVAEPLVSVNCNSTLTVSERSLLLRRGRCPTCGIQTHKVRGMFKKSYRPLSNEHVLSGRCLLCKPINIVTRQPVELAIPASSLGVESSNRVQPLKDGLDFEDSSLLGESKVLETEVQAEHPSISQNTTLASTTTPTAPSLATFLDLEAGGYDESKSIEEKSIKYFSRAESRDEVERWLLSRLPTLQKRDIERYCHCFEEEGFDSKEMLEVVEEEDLGFMKTAHRRVLLKRLRLGMDPPGCDDKASLPLKEPTQMQPSSLFDKAGPAVQSDLSLSSSSGSGDGAGSSAARAPSRGAPTRPGARGDNTHPLLPYIHRRRQSWGGSSGQNQRQQSWGESEWHRMQQSLGGGGWHRNDIVGAMYSDLPPRPKRHDQRRVHFSDTVLSTSKGLGILEQEIADFLQGEQIATADTRNVLER